MAGVFLSTSAFAQVIEVTAYGLAATNAEVDRTRQAKGFGLGVGVGTELGRFLVEVRGQTASLHADFSIQPDYVVNELTLLATYRWRPALALLLGTGRRFASPDFAAQEVGFIGVGLLTETSLSSLGRARAHAAYLPLTRFSGGGESGLAMEFGLGVSIGPTDSRFTGVVDYTYQRIDREVNGGAVPIQYSTARAGVAVRW